MNTKIQSVHFDADIKLLSFIESKLNKLEKKDESILGAEVILRIEKAENGENKLVEIKLMVPGNDLFASRHSKTFEEATDLAIDALNSQLIKIKKKHKE